MGLAQLPAGMRAVLVLLGEPLPPGSVQLLQQLRTWAVTMGAQAQHALLELLRRRGRVRSGA